MVVNIVLALAIALVTGALAGLGGQLASTERWHKWVFWGGAVVIWALIAAQTYRNEMAQRKLEGQLDKIQRNTETPPNVTVNVPQSTVTLPSTPQHTHVEYLDVVAANQLLGIQQPGFNVGDTPKVPMVFRNAGAFAVRGPADGGLVTLVATKKIQSVFRDSRNKFLNAGPGGSLPAGSSSGLFHTFLGPKLSAEDVKELMLGELSLCGVGAVKWLDDTGTYETYFGECLIAEPNHQSANWHLLKENNVEKKLK